MSLKDYEATRFRFGRIARKIRVPGTFRRHRERSYPATQWVSPSGLELIVSGYGHVSPYGTMHNMRLKFLECGRLTFLWYCLSLLVLTSPASAQSSRVTIESDGWHLVGDLVLPAEVTPVPAVLMLNGAAGDRTVYENLAAELVARNIASLRVDLRGHGESINRGRFVPGAEERSPLIWDAELDVEAALRFLRGHSRVDSMRLGVIGASYSGEEMAEAGRVFGYARTYVALSPGSFSAESITDIDRSGVPWLFVVSRDERFLREITADIRERSERAHLEILPGTEHAARLLRAHPELAERIAVWLTARLGA